ncbi:MAG TPA: SAM-dependent methyltransferase, partial [Anaerolineae bacterium]
MSFDKPTRNALARMVGAIRERLKDDITAQLQSDFRLQPDGTLLSLDGLSEDQRAAAEELRQLLEHFAAPLPQAEEKTKQPNAHGAQSANTGADAVRAQAYDRLVREIGFTILNRLAALRLCEERGLVIECVRQGMTSDGFRLFDQLTGGALGPRYATYRAFLENLFDELAIDLGMLFDRHSPLSHVFPSERALEDVLNRLNDPNLKQLWTEDETIGWIYQYYNDEAERKQMRDASQAPRNSRELAVRNQFFTPRYVVEFLTDNTLGRIWYEIRGGETVLRERCRYLVIRPDDKMTGSSSSFIPHPSSFRPKKDPRDIKMLDPAGGSGHFGLYCFDLFETIYEEAYDDADLGPHLQSEFHDRAEFLRQ